MELYYTVKAIYEDDFGCEERSADHEPQVIVVLVDSQGMETVIRQPDAWLYAQDINEGDTVTMVKGRLFR